MNNAPIHIALASDANGVAGLVVTVWSALRRTSRPLSVYIIEEDIPVATREQLVGIWHRSPMLASVQFIAQRNLPYQVPSWWLKEHWPLVACSRFQLADVLPPEVLRCIWLDIDILVNVDLVELFDQPIGNNVVGMVVNTGMKDTDCEYVLRIGLDPATYCNSGVMLMDLVALRAEDAGRRLIEQTRSMPLDLWFFDQDVVNLYFRGRIELLDERWNYRKSNTPAENCIQHFAGRPKPWQREPEGDIGFTAWHATLVECGFVAPRQSRTAEWRNKALVQLARLQRKVLRLLSTQPSR